jgi:uncharacterized coiled-coil DUF342 family protein
METVNPVRDFIVVHGSQEMTQEDHWKKAYRDLKEKHDAEGTERDERYRLRFDDLEKQYREAITTAHSLKAKANTLINELEVVLHFTHDDIRSSLAEDTVKRIEEALDKIRIHYGLNPRFK